MKFQRFNFLALPGLFFLLSSFQVEKVDSAKILSIAFFSTKSHKITYEPLLRELAKRGHEVTMVNPNPGKDGKNFKYIETTDPEKVLGQFNIFDMKLKMPAIATAYMNPYLFLGGIVKDLCGESLMLPQVQQLLNQKFDLVFFPPLFNECLYGFIHKLNASVILYQQAGVITWTADNLGTPSPPSFVPNSMVAATDRLSFLTRLRNFIHIGLDNLILHLYYYPLIEKLYRDILNDPSIPPVTEIEKNASLMLSNSHISFNQPRPMLPDIIEVGGMHLVPAKPVQPKELDDFLSGGKDGFILFSLGSAAKGSLMPEKYRKIFLNVFSKLKQRVLWKWETEQMEDLPPNVKLSKWIPQQDVLGHKNIRAFITHGGLGSTSESIFHGVPLIGIPLGADQPTNLKKAHARGFAIPPLELSDLTEEILLDAINTVLNDPSYRENAKKLSSIYLDQMNKPLERGVYWVEYVLRHQGALHLRSAARDLNFIQYFSLDVIAVLLAIAAVITTVNILIVRALYRRCCSSKKAEKKDSRKKKQ
jgi:glucuronosyltransferase